MPTFVYTGRTKAGALQTGEMIAQTQEEAVGLLRKKQLLITSIKKKSASLQLNLSFLNKGVKEKDIVIFTRQFATMIDAGLPLVQCLDILSQQSENPTLRKVLGEVRQDVEAGSTYADALKKFPKIFDDLYVNMVVAGEAGGILDVILNRLAKYIEKSMKLKEKVKSAMYYPASIVGISIGVISILMVFVIPKFATMFTDFGGTLPVPTLIVINSSHFMKDNIFIIIGVVCGMVYGFKKIYATDAGHYAIDKFLIKVPVMGTLIVKATVAKFTRTLGTLISSGVPILEGLSVVAKTSGNKVFEEAINRTRQSISEGKNIADYLGQSKVFPSMVVQMISVGESTGALDAMLSKIADFYDDEVDSAVTALTSLMEPIIMAILGVIIGFIVVAMYLPIFKMASVV